MPGTLGIQCCCKLYVKDCAPDAGEHRGKTIIYFASSRSYSCTPGNVVCTAHCTLTLEQLVRTVVHAAPDFHHAAPKLKLCAIYCCRLLMCVSCCLPCCTTATADGDIVLRPQACHALLCYSSLAVLLLFLQLSQRTFQALGVTCTSHQRKAAAQQTAGLFVSERSRCMQLQLPHCSGGAAACYGTGNLV
jgi:hypothetical protein